MAVWPNIILFLLVVVHGAEAFEERASKADNFDKPNAGFVCAYDASAARRQFQVSSMLVLVLVLPTFALGGPHVAEMLLDICR